VEREKADHAIATMYRPGRAAAGPAAGGRGGLAGPGADAGAADAAVDGELRSVATHAPGADSRRPFCDYRMSMERSYQAAATAQMVSGREDG
jgi:hypothetical protein